jgi:hypothetical protein
MRAHQDRGRASGPVLPTPAHDHGTTACSRWAAASSPTTCVRSAQLQLRCNVRGRPARRFAQTEVPVETSTTDRTAAELPERFLDAVERLVHRVRRSAWRRGCDRVQRERAGWTTGHLTFVLSAAVADLVVVTGVGPHSTADPRQSTSRSTTGSRSRGNTTSTCTSRAP